MATFRLLDSGHVDRPRVVTARLWTHASSWSMHGDTLIIDLSTMATGWQLTLVPTQPHSDAAYTGTALYVTDVVVDDAQPLRVPVAVEREACAPSG